LSYAFQGLAVCAPFIPWAMTPGPLSHDHGGDRGLLHRGRDVHVVERSNPVHADVGGGGGGGGGRHADDDTRAIMAKVPAGWDELFFGWRLELDWSGLIPELNERIHGARAMGIRCFLFILLLLVKGLFVSMAGPTNAIQHALTGTRAAALEIWRCPWCRSGRSFC
jgi:hypothetical protein